MNAEMPKYRCHKVVHALKIQKVEHNVPPEDSESDGSCTITPEEYPFMPFSVGRDYINKHKPVAGGYFVVYEDGYQSFSPAKAFEDGYTRV